MRHRSPARYLGVGLACLFLGGCYQEIVSGDVTTITYAWWMLPVSVLGGILACVIGWYLHKSKSWGWWFPWMFLLGGPAALVFFVPTTVMDKVIVDSEQFTVVSGTWLTPQRAHAKFADTRRFLLTSQKLSLSKDDDRKVHYLECISKQGTTQRVSIGDLLLPALDKIRRQAELHGIAYDDNRR